MSSFLGIGIMSGSSMDGLDLCAAEFMGDPESDVWGYRIEHAITVAFSKEMKEQLGRATTMSGLELMELQRDFSHFMGQCLEQFIQNKQLKPDFAASHGHTVFHQPDKGLTFQLGDGEIVACYVKCPFVCNFRSKDVSLGGQGSPLVPCGEKFLFQQTDMCISLGGIANIGFKGAKGFDVCPCNIVLNHLAEASDPELSFDKDGQLAASGQVISELVDRLNKLDFYQQTGPRSLGYEWVSREVFPLLNPEDFPIPDLMCTFVEHIASHVSQECVKTIAKKKGTVLVTGGGAYNITLMEKLRAKLNEYDIKVIETENETVEYKEAVVYAFLGLRSLLGVENIFSNVTGSRKDTVSGSIHHGSAAHMRTPNLTDRFNFMIRKKSRGVNELRIIKEK